MNWVKMNFFSVLRHFKTKVVSEKTWNILRGGLFCTGCDRVLHALYRVHKKIIFTLNIDLLENKGKTLHTIYLSITCSD